MSDCLFRGPDSTEDPIPQPPFAHPHSSEIAAGPAERVRSRSAPAVNPQAPLLRPFTKKFRNLYIAGAPREAPSRPRNWKEGKEMAGVGMLLDPIKMGREAEAFDAQLRKRIVGQDEAVR